jgi:hypothetical protein
MQQVSKLTTQQEVLLPEYKRKWQLIELSTQAIDVCSSNFSTSKTRSGVNLYLLN